MRKSIAAAAVSAAVLMPIASATVEAREGRASWYALKSRTANGEMMNPSAMTAAHRTLPFGTRVRVHNLDNGRSAVVRINDRGPFIRGRVIDVSRAAASRLGFVNAGTARVRLTTVGGGATTTVAGPAPRARGGALDRSGDPNWEDGKPRFER